MVLEMRFTFFTARKHQKFIKCHNCLNIISVITCSIVSAVEDWKVFFFSFIEVRELLFFNL